MKEIKIKRVYDGKEYGDGYRVLVDRLWPRGVSKEDAAIDEWAKDITPKDQLRKDVHSERITWEEFKNIYSEDLKGSSTFKDWKNHINKIRKRRYITLVTGAKLHDNGHPYIIKEALEEN
ncbi:MAG: DUF488 family protein [Tissierellia bacterium]|nr:DUF488 family protein [Tissierellia bacterium]